MRYLYFPFFIFSTILVQIFPQHLNASHMMGAEITYSSLGNGKYHITAKIYRDCRGIAFSNPTFGAFAGTNGGNTCGSYSLSISRTSIRDVTRFCSKRTAPCYPANTYSTGEGVEEHVFETDVNFNTAPLVNFLNKSSCCSVVFYIGQCCRNGAITTGSASNDFYAECMINLCLLKRTLSQENSAPLKVAPPQVFLVCNNPVRLNDGCVDTVEYDSIGYSLVPCLGGLPNISVYYSSPFTFRYFATPYCLSTGTIKCQPDPSAIPPLGLFFDDKTGEIIFTPTKCDEVSAYCVRANEYRRDKNTGDWLLIGYSSRDIQIIIKDGIKKNQDPEIHAPDNLILCEAADTAIWITVTDTSLRLGQSSPDTVHCTITTNLEKSNITYLDSAGSVQVIRVGISKGEFSTNKGHRTLRIETTDDVCPIPGVAVKTIEILFYSELKPEVKLNADSSNGICGDLKLTQLHRPQGWPSLKDYYNPVVTKVSHQDSQKVILKDSVSEFIILTQLAPGKVLVKRSFNIASGCDSGKVIVITDTISIPQNPQLITNNFTSNCGILNYSMFDQNKVTLLRKFQEVKGNGVSFTDSIHWDSSFAIQPGQSGNFSLKQWVVTPEGCADISYSNITVLKPFWWDRYYGKARINVLNFQQLCADDRVPVKGTVKWYYNGEYLQTGRCVNNPLTGQYRYSFEDDSCTADTFFSVGEYFRNPFDNTFFPESDGLNVAPVPFTSALNITVSYRPGHTNTHITITDISGRAVCDSYFTENSFHLNTETWPCGMYILMLEDETGYLIRKIVKVE